MSMSILNLVKALGQFSGHLGCPARRTHTAIASVFWPCCLCKSFRTYPSALPTMIYFAQEASEYKLIYNVKASMANVSQQCSQDGILFPEHRQGDLSTPPAVNESHLRTVDISQWDLTQHGSKRIVNGSILLTENSPKVRCM
jgi:hypothetical protein